jgi:hypothetical protein
MANSSSREDRPDAPPVRAIDPVERGVMGVLKDNETFASDTLQEIPETDRASIDAAFLRFFPHLKNVRGGYWSNLPLGTKLSHYLLIGVAPVLDLRPISPEKFESEHGLTIGAAEELVTNGGMLANLYVRDPKQWRGMHHLSGLIAKSVVNGIRVDYCLSALNPQFEKTPDDIGLKALRSEQFGKALASAPPSEFAHVKEIIHADTDDKIARQARHQWAYLDVLKPDGAIDIATLVNERRLGTAVDLLRIIKRAYVSAYTAALAGTCVWGPKDQETLFRLGEGHQLPAQFVAGKAWTDAERLAGQPPSALQVMVEELTRTPGVAVVTQPSIEKLLELQRREDWNAIKRAIFDRLLEVTRLAQADGYDAEKIEDLRRWLREQRRMLKHYQLGGAEVAGGAGWAIAGLIGFGVGIVFGPMAGAATAGQFGQPLGDLGSKLGVRLGSWAHQMARPEHHRLVLGLNKLRRSHNG